MRDRDRANEQSNTRLPMHKAMNEAKKKEIERQYKHSIQFEFT